MDFELRSVLLIVGIVVIAAILLHGLLNIRQSNKPVDISDLDLDKSDFNEDMSKDSYIENSLSNNISAKDSLSDNQSTSNNQNASDAIKRHESLKTEPADDVQSPLSLDDSNEEVSAPINFDIALDGTKDDVNAANNPTPMFSSPIAQEKEDFLSTKPSVDNIEQVDINENEAREPKIGDVALDADVDDNQKIESDDKEKSSNQKKEQEVMDVLVLNVVGDDDVELDGARLLPTLLTLGFKFGDMNIFHRHVDAAGQGPVLFSLANMVQPGFFDIDNMEQFSTKGVSLFMTLPHKSGNMETFNIMLNASAKIAEEFGGQVLDGNRSTLTKQSTQQYVQRIREVERQLLLIK